MLLLKYLKKILLWLPLFALLSGFNQVLAQKKKKEAKDKYKLTSMKAKIGENPHFQRFPIDFPNVNKLFYYQDFKKLKKIQKLERKEQYAKLLPALEAYVSNFGIRNFYSDTRMIWKLAQLYEKMADIQRAKSMFRLVLKHHRQDINHETVIQYFEGLDKNQKDYFIPLDYYYELVEFRRGIDTLRPPTGVLVDMGPEINSRFPDYAPSLSPGGDTLFFSSKRTRKRELNITANIVANEDIYISPGYEGFWDESYPLKDLNTEFNEGSAIISKDGKTMIFARCNYPKGYGDCDLFQAELTPNGTWGNTKNLGPNVNSRAWDSQPALSPTEDTLYFASNRIGGFGLSDIFISIKQSSGMWGRAMNLGPIVNTRGNEVSPFVHPQFKVLYFSSNGHMLNFGDFDIYKTYYRNGQWTEPYNIGPLVNGKGSEYYFTIDKDAKKLYYARSDSNDLKNLNLYSFPLPMEAQPLATTSFSGTITDSTGKPLEGVVTVIDLDNGIEVVPKFVRPDGSFDFSLINQNNYLLVIQGDDFFRIEKMFFLAGDTSINTKASTIKSQKITFTSVEFEGGSSQIAEIMHADLDRVMNFLIDHPEVKLNISGHTDQTGDLDANLKLSKARAEAIKEYIIASGYVAPDRITAIGYGSEKPIVSEEMNERDRRMNRRVEFEIIIPEGPVRPTRKRLN